MGWISLVLVAVMGIGWGMTPVNRSMFRHRRWGAVLVSAAGPLVNLLLALIAGFVLVIAARAHGGVGHRVLWFWGMVLEFNVLLFLFNLIPVPPFDGFSVADGAFDLGGLGAMLRGAGMIPLILAMLLVRSEPFSVFSDGIVRLILRAAQGVVGA
jgi:Zn-dependent protease